MLDQHFWAALPMIPLAAVPLQMCRRAPRAGVVLGEPEDDLCAAWLLELGSLNLWQNRSAIRVLPKRKK